LDGRNYCGSGHINLTRLFNDSFQSRPDIPLALLKQSKRVRVPIDAGTVSESKLCCDGRRRTPADEGCFDLFPLLVSTDRTIPLVPAKAHSRVGLALLVRVSIVVRLRPLGKQETYTLPVRTTYSGLGVNWNGFRPVVYSFGERALNASLKQSRWHGDEKVEEDTSIERLLQDLEGKRFQVEDNLTAISITTETGSLNLHGPPFNCRLAATILELLKEGIKPLASRWVWYDTDESDTDPTTSYSFFVIHEDRIVRERVSFLDFHNSGFDPAVFDSGDDSDDSNWDLAWAAYWYRRFYRETRVGQLMVLRPDMPALHYYPEGRPWHKLEGAVSSVDDLRRVRALLWVAVSLLALIAFLLIRK
jgi:hypothetical protein